MLPREIVATALALGTRLDETLRLEWHHVDLDATRYRTIARVETRAGSARIAAPDWL